jgi:ATP-dependent Clp protease ATP-binding subunit ClpB
MRCYCNSKSILSKRAGAFQNRVALIPQSAFPWGFDRVSLRFKALVRHDQVRGHFRPEFLNRLDEIILFHRLAMEHMAPIVDIQVGRVQKLLKDRKITLDLTDAARRWLGRVGCDPVYGARPLKRAVQRYLQDPLADMLLRGEVPDGSAVAIDEGDGELKMVVS